MTRSTKSRTVVHCLAQLTIYRRVHEIWSWIYLWYKYQSAEELWNCTCNERMLIWFYAWVALITLKTDSYQALLGMRRYNHRLYVPNTQPCRRLDAHMSGTAIKISGNLNYNTFQIRSHISSHNGAHSTAQTRNFSSIISATQILKIAKLHIKASSAHSRL